MGQDIKVLCANIQAGATTRSKIDYLVKGWNVWLPFGKSGNLAAIAQHAAEHDIVGLQETDGGSIRSGFACQATVIGSISGLPHATRQVNREIGPIIASGNALLGKYDPLTVRSVPLPSKIPGRGVLLAEYALVDGQRLTVVVAHLSLSAQARRNQLSAIADMICEASNPILMGDLNCPISSPEMQLLFSRTKLAPPAMPQLTYPSWLPSRAIDHILVGGSIVCKHVQAVRIGGSDHLALSATLSIPSKMALTRLA